MRTVFLLAILCIPLTLTIAGCGAAQTGMQNARLASALQKATGEMQMKCAPYLTLSPDEARAWGSLTETMPRLCPGINTQPWPLNKAQAISSCAAAQMTKKIRPVSYSQRAFDAYMKDRAEQHQLYANGETSWEDMSRSAGSRQGQYLTGGKNGVYTSYASCKNDIMQRVVAPSYPAQLQYLLNGFMTDQLAIARAADKKNLPVQDYIIQADKGMSNFMREEQAAINAYNAQSYARSQQQAAAMRDVSRSLLEHDAAVRTNRPKSVTCIDHGMHVICNEF